MIPLKRLIAVLVLCGLVACSQQGGGEVCPCATPIVITATTQLGATATSGLASVTPTPTDGSSSTQPTFSPTPIRGTPTRFPTFAVTSTPDSCWHRSAAYSKGWAYQYLDTRNTGLRQNLRAGPGLNYPIVGTLAKNTPREVFYTADGWFSLDSFCRTWAISILGELVAIGTN